MGRPNWSLRGVRSDFEVLTSEFSPIRSSFEDISRDFVKSRLVSSMCVVYRSELTSKKQDNRWRSGGFGPLSNSKPCSDLYFFRRMGRPNWSYERCQVRL